ncbi:MAG: hypothetical protein WC584_02685 [Candidatus Pacearchaeota archaeon]
MYKEFNDIAMNSIGWTALIALGVAIAVVAILALYIYKSIVWMKIAKRLKHKNAWLAWVPIADVAMILQLGDFHWAWIFLILIPFFGWIALGVLFVVANWRIFEECGYPGWFSLSLIIPKVGVVLYLVVIGFIIWSDQNTKVVVNKKSQKFVEWVKKDKKKKRR